MCVELRESEMKAFSHTESAVRLLFIFGGGGFSLGRCGFVTVVF